MSLVVINMPKISRFERDRIAKLMGHKTRPIKKTPEKEPSSTPLGKKALPKEPATTDKSDLGAFKASNYIQMEKVYKVSNRPYQIQKVDFRCFNDEEVFDAEGMNNFLKLNHDNDHDTPEEQIKYDVNRGVKKLKEELERKQLGEGEGEPSEKPISVKGSAKGTPPGFVGIRLSK
jgi:hypothetical protein